MNNLFLANNLCCCAMGRNDDEVRIMEKVLLVKQDGTVVDNSFVYNSIGIEEGETYIAKKFWVIRKSLTDFARFDTKEEAEKEYNRILKELSESNTIIRI